MPTKEEALRKIESLVQRFDEQKEFYKKADYNETQTRRDFIDPFWKALGWDIDNENNYAESYREVIHEDRVKVDGKTKAPDYSFRLSGGKRLFFLEAKKPSVSIKEEIEPAYQVRRYGWSAKMAISVISDFEEFAIYDCTQKPKSTDKASVARIKYLTYKDYENEFDFIWDTFSKERVLKGSFDKYILSDKDKKGTTTVDRDFLASLDKWRIELAKNIALRNKNLNEDELNFLVQSTLDRIIFLRIAEDRHVERYGELQDCVCHSRESGNPPKQEIAGQARNDISFYQNLLLRFNVADQKYNSGLFDFQKDKISAGIVIDNKVIKSIISELYYPICPYEFSVLSVEILGSAYEQFLGKTITLSASGKTAKIEEKPEVRKAGGVYYTPQYIVDYIVKNTVGKLVENKTPEEVSIIKICDPACGSGSFLIGAYQYLLNWHKDYYTKNGSPLLRRGVRGEVLTPQGELTTAEKKRILLNNIYGVDLDSNAVEVTKLSLLLKCMEGETKETIEAQTKLFHDRILPTLDNNIKSGNSLIDLDYYDSQLDFGEERKIKPFSWQKAFPDVFNRYVPVDKRQPFKEQYEKVMKLQSDIDNLITSYTVNEPEEPYLRRVSGFDCVIGNPPYYLVEDPVQKEYFKAKYQTLHFKINLFTCFCELGNKLLRKNGKFSFIIPNLIFANDSLTKLREHILNNYKIEQLINLGDGVFPQVTMPTMIFVLTKDNSKADNIVSIYPKIEGTIIDNTSFSILQNSILTNFNSVFETSNPDSSKLIKRLEKDCQTIEDVLEVNQGIITGNDKKFLSDEQKTLDYKLTIRGRDISSYRTNYPNLYVNYVKNQLACPRTEDLFDVKEKILMRRTGDYPIASYDDKHAYNLHTLYSCRNKSQFPIKLLLALLNSKVFRFIYQEKLGTELGRTFAEIKIVYIRKLPVPKTINKTCENEIVRNVDLLLQLNKDLQTATLPEHKEQIKSRIDYCEDKINEIVYELYGLTEEEIKIVEGK